ncbi:XVIPCD domain-containing protein [Luteimonas kalidii]|uniref:Peptidoglycan-binding protein n=1 Tax=Luteimonas kalidii TaxID=3042025 RepID=A0ABT6JVV6_9GAMM|nr:XVIPCD domain-containing protein [Luteimonas kalidii]MDH5834828.1 peptidoglycan-binding protein [Luteimonas kalidii]
MSNQPGTAYTVRQYVFDARGERNEDVRRFEDLVTHHPRANADAQMEDGRIIEVERPSRRSHAFIGGAYQEVETARTDEYRTLKPDQVLLIKDFILEQNGRRALDVPAPISGVVGRVDAPNGMVEVLDREGGDVVARVRHLNPIAVASGDHVSYGDTLGTQNNQGLRLPRGSRVHVHIEMDTKHYQQFGRYVDDLASGRLTVEARHRSNVPPGPLDSDGTFRIGTSSDRIATVQRALAADGYRATGERPITVDGVYRADMQGALLAFQQDHRIPQTGDVDPATVQVALRVNLDRPLGPAGRTPLPAIDALPSPLREIGLGLDPRFTPRHGEPAPDAGHPADPARTQRAPRHHAHPFHDPTPPLERPRKPDAPGHPDHVLLERIRDGVRAFDADAGKPWDTYSERLSAGLLVRAKASGFDGGDAVRVAASRPTDASAAGEFVCLLRHGPTASPDPAENLVRVRVVDALAIPVDQHYAQLERIDRERTAVRNAAVEHAIGPPGQDVHALG